MTIASATPDLDAPLWRYWTSSSAEYQVLWGDDGLPLGLVEAKRTKRDARAGQQHRFKLQAFGQMHRQHQ